MSIDAEMELVIIHLIRVEERARFFGRSKEQLDKLALLKRALANMKKELAASR